MRISDWSSDVCSSDLRFRRITDEIVRLMTIQRYGIYNPFTGNGAIKGLMPHGPHNIRDVLATHILKQTGSYEQASYAIQDTPEMRSEERRVGKECVSTCRSRWSPYH